MAWKIIDRILLPAAFFLIAFVAALTLWQLLIGHRRAEIEGGTSEQVSFVKSKLESELRARVRPLERLARRNSDRATPDHSAIESDASLVMSAYPTYQAIEWVDPSFHVRWVTPLKGNEREPGADVSADERQREALQAAEKSAGTIASGPVN